MTEPAPAYRIVMRAHVNRWDDDLQTAVPGWEIKARWVSTGAVLPVFLPDASYTADNVDTLIRAAGARDEEVHRLGG